MRSETWAERNQREYKERFKSVDKMMSQKMGRFTEWYLVPESMKRAKQMAVE